MNTPKGYLLAELKIHDGKSFVEAYKSRVQAVLELFDAKILAVVDDPIATEGDRPVDQIVLLEFESVAHAKHFYESKAYQDILHHRLASASADLFIFEGAPSGSKMTR